MGEGGRGREKVFLLALFSFYIFNKTKSKLKPKLETCCPLVDRLVVSVYNADATHVTEGIWTL